ncbi:MAG: class I SAM-dependent methyltransferase [Planctomycetes bacterium]|nr:class I SAM-dependent methyltransferase [Planctomycetota bacterium]
MAELISKTGERVIPEDFKSRQEYILYLRHLFAYEFAKHQIPKDSVVLEVGCGEGYGANVLSQEVKKIFALDVDKNAVAHASKKYGSENCIYRAYDGAKIPYEDASFDAAVSFQVIEHIEDDANYVSQVHRVLKKDGMFICTTPNRTHRLKPGQKPLNEFHVREYYPHELESLLKSKFSDVKVWGIRGNKEVQAIEMERVKPVFDPTLDPLNLRMLMPRPLRRAISKIIKNVTRKNPKDGSDVDFLDKYSLDDHYVIKDNIEESLALLAICKK